MQQRTLPELLGVSSQRGAPTPRTAQDGGSARASDAGSLPRSPGARRGQAGRCARPPSGAPLWAWLLLAALLLPGAWSFLSEEQEELLVELHNHYRGQVSPTASAMLPLKWDPNLKLLAESYAAKCVWNHNPELEDTGENLFAGNGPLDLREALEKWFLEYADYDFNNNSCDEDKMCGHYTQMVWAETHRVGCAFHLCNNMEGLDWDRVSFLVCNYFPAGNYEGERPYVEGDWCSRCPENLQKCENNLCVADVEEGEEDDEEDPDPTLVPPYDTTELLPAADEEEQRPTSDAGEDAAVVPPPATTESLLPPPAAGASTPAPIATASFRPRPQTPPPGTPPPAVHATVQEEEEIEEVKAENSDSEELGQGVKRTSNLNIIIIANAAGAASPPLLLACLTAILTVRL